MSAVGGDIPRPETEHARGILGSCWPSQSESAWRRYADELFSSATHLLGQEGEQSEIVLLLGDQVGATADALMGLAQARQTSLRDRTDHYRAAHQAADRGAARLVAAKVNMAIAVELAESTIAEAKAELIPQITAAQAVGDGPLACTLMEALVDRCTTAIDTARDAVAAEDTAAAIEVAALAAPFLAAIAAHPASTGGAGAVQPVDYRPALGDAGAAHQPAATPAAPATAAIRPALGGTAPAEAHQPAATGPESAPHSGAASPSGRPDVARPDEAAAAAPAQSAAPHTSTAPPAPPAPAAAPAASPLASLSQALTAPTSAGTSAGAPAAGSPTAPGGAPATAAAPTSPAGVPATPRTPGLALPISGLALGSPSAAAAGVSGPVAASLPAASPAASSGGVSSTAAPASPVPAAGASASAAGGAGSGGAGSMGSGAVAPALPAAALGAPVAAAAVPTTQAASASAAAPSAAAPAAAPAGGAVVATTASQAAPPLVIPADRDEAAHAAAGIVATLVAQARRRGHGNVPVAVTVLAPVAGDGVPVAWLATGFGPSWLPPAVRIPAGVRLAVTDPVVGRELWSAAEQAGSADPVDTLVAHARAAAEPPSALLAPWRVLAIAGTGHPAQIEAAAAALRARGVAVDASEIEPAEPGDGGETRCAAALPRLAARVDGYTDEQHRRLVALALSALIDARPSVAPITRMTAPAAVREVAGAWIAFHQARAVGNAGPAWRHVMACETAALAAVSDTAAGCADLLYAAHLAGITTETLTGEDTHS